MVPLMTALGSEFIGPMRSLAVTHPALQSEILLPEHPTLTPLTE